MNIKKCIIIGSGPSGYTAGIYASRANLSPVLYTGEVIGGQLTTTTDVENFPGYPKGVDGNQMMLDLREQSERFGTTIVESRISKVDFSVRPFRLWDESNNEIQTETVIISTGASAKYLGLESEKKYLENGGGVSACATCDGFFHKDKDVVIVGAGDSACEEALLLSKLCNKVTMLIRRDKFKASNIMKDRVLTTENIEVLYNTTTEEVMGDDEYVTGVKVKTNNEESIIECSGFFVAIGHTPNTDIFSDFIDLDKNNYILTENGGTKTNVEGVFACGDVMDSKYRQAVTAAGSGCMASIDVDRYLTEKSK
jgi:thioredoxin reductase (NADPH)